MDTFKTIKGMVDIRDVAKRFGVHVTHSNKAICPFHEEETASLSFKGQDFRCFGCDAHGDVFDFVSMLHGLTKPLDAAKLINEAFALGIDFQAPANIKELAIMNQRKSAEKAALIAWEQKAFRVLSSYFRFLRAVQNDYAPTSPDHPPHPLYVEACSKIDYIEYLLTNLDFHNLDAVRQFKQSHSAEIRAIYNRLKWGMMPYAGGSDLGAGRPAVQWPVSVPDSYTGKAA